MICLLTIPTLTSAQSNGDIVVLKSRYPNRNYIKLQNDQVIAGDIENKLKSGMWVYEEVPNKPFFRLRKAGTDKQYLNAVKGKLVCKYVPSHSKSSHWKRIKTDKFGYYRIQNQYDKTVFINSKGGGIKASNVPVDSYSSHWTFKPKNKQGKKYVYEEKQKPTTRPKTKPVTKPAPKPLYEPKPKKLTPAPLPNSTKVDGNHDEVLTNYNRKQSNSIQFSLSVNKNITWWKAVKVYTSSGDLLCMLETQDNQGKKYSIEFTPSQIENRVKIEYWKAKAFGAHTHVGTEYLNVSEIEGFEVAFKWMND